MTVTELRNQIIIGRDIQSFYVFTGPEIYVQNIYANQLSKVKGLTLVRVEDAKTVLQQIKNTSFLNQSKCYVVRDDLEFVKDEKLQEAIKSNLTGNLFILLLTNLDKRSRFYKQYDVVEFEYLSPEVLHKYIQADIPLNNKNCDKLIEVCERDYSRIQLEIDKIKWFSLDVNTAFEKLLADGTIYQPAKDCIFDLVDAVVTRKTDSFRLYDICVQYGTSTLAILSLLYNNFKQILQVQSCESKDIAQATGLTQWQIKCSKERLGCYGIGELVYAIKTIHQMEYQIKTGTMPEELAIPYLLVNLL